VEEDHDRPIHNPGGAGHDSDADGTEDADKMREYLKKMIFRTQLNMQTDDCVRASILPCQGATGIALVDPNWPNHAREIST